MTVKYTCRHCDTEIGSIPVESVRDLILSLKDEDESQEERFVHVAEDGTTTVRCICEHCEESLRMNPDYHTLKKWIQ